MKKISDILLSAAMISAAPVVSAQPNTYVDADMKTRLFTLSQKWEGNSATFTRALSDDTIGVLCDWKISGKIDPDTKRISARVEHHECSATKTTPETWLGGKLLDDEKFSPSVHLLIPLHGNPIVVEQRITDTNSLGVSSTYSRIWDFAKNEVCIRHYEGQFVDNLLKVYVDMKGGCYKMPNNRYSQRIREKLDTKWSALKAP